MAVRHLLKTDERVTPREYSTMSRMVSFIVLVVVVLAIAILFFKVMAGFILPLFLAVLLVVMFRPLHGWFQRKLPHHRRLAAGATTLSILLIFLVPMCFIFFEAGSEAYSIYNQIDTKEFDPAVLDQKLAQINDYFGSNITAEQVEGELIKRGQKWMAPMLVVTTQYVISLVIGLCIMVIALYYFLLDGSSMMSTIMRLSPLDDTYESQLVEEFDRTSRAVVLASVVSAVMQGLLAGIGYYFADLEFVFLLTVLTMLFAMVPFIGAAAIWVPCCIWLFWSGHTTAAIVLALYGMVIVSMVDNIIKPAILHGRSNLHPLLALLSVLGGVKVLGPIGIFVGPMAVTFLHAVLVMLQKEIDLLGNETKNELLDQVKGKEPEKKPRKNKNKR